MPLGLTLTILVVLALAGFAAGRQRALAMSDGTADTLHSLPSYHGLFVALCILLPAVAFLHVAVPLERPVGEWMLGRGFPELVESAEDRSLVTARIGRIARGGPGKGTATPLELDAASYLQSIRERMSWLAGLGTLALGAASGGWALRRTHREFRARNWSERIIGWGLFLCSFIAIMTTVGIVLSLLTEALRFFAFVSPADFFFGLEWSPREAMRADQVGSSGRFGVVPVLAGTFLITGIAMAVALPVGLLAAIYMVEFASDRMHGIAKPLLEVLAGVPTVVYGFFAAVTVAPFVRDVGNALGITTSSQSALAAGSVMGVMIIPFISSLSDDVIAAVPMKLREGAYSLGATKGETVVRVVLPAALPGLLSATVLAVSRALGETMIVVMAAGLFANLTANPFDAVTTVTVQITTVLTGDQEFDSATTLSAFALALLLFAVTFLLNVVALRVMERYRERYD